MKIRDLAPTWRPSLAVAFVAALAFLPATFNGFVDFDDDRNFLQNLDFRGLGWPQVRWALTTDLVGVYQPLGWLLLEVQWAVGGMDPRAYHLASLAMHALNGALVVALCFAVLGRCGLDPPARGVLGTASGLAAALFAAHPLRAECVAWASCQTFLPCASFLILAVLAYLRGAGRPGRGRLAWLSASWLLYGASLGCKGVGVGLPVVLLLLDAYPLGRFGASSSRSSRAAAWAEKIPFALLSSAFLYRGVVAKRAHHALDPVAHEGISSRVAQACYGLCFYPAKTLEPTGLCAFYPLPARLDLLDRGFAACALAASAAGLVAFLLRRRWPGLLVALAAYLALLAPNLGVVRIGRLLVADRYSYAASLPGVVLSAYVLAGLLAGPRWRGRAVVAAVAVSVVLLAAASWRQCRTWKDSASLWARAVACAGRDDLSLRTYLGVALAREGRLGEAIEQFSEAVRIGPGQARARLNLGRAIARSGRPDRAIPQLARAVELEPGLYDARDELGLALMSAGRPGEAKVQLAEASRIRPGSAEAHNKLGIALLRSGDPADAVAEIEAAVRLRPDVDAYRSNLADAIRERARAGDRRGGPR